MLHVCITCRLAFRPCISLSFFIKADFRCIEAFLAASRLVFISSWLRWSRLIVCCAISSCCETSLVFGSSSLVFGSSSKPGVNTPDTTPLSALQSRCNLLGLPRAVMIAAVAVLVNSSIRSANSAACSWALFDDLIPGKDLRTFICHRQNINSYSTCISSTGVNFNRKSYSLSHKVRFKAKTASLIIT